MGAGEDALGQRDGVRRAIEVELDAAAVALRTHLDRPAQGRGERVLRGRERLGEIGVDLAREALGLRLGLTLSLARSALRLAYRPAAVARLERQSAAGGVVLA